MKVERKDKQFVPIVITLETKEEAKNLKHIANCGTGHSMIEYCGKDEYKSTANINEIQNLKNKLYNCLDDVE